jgi:hypothetical protein
MATLLRRQKMQTMRSRAALLLASVLVAATLTQIACDDDSTGPRPPRFSFGLEIIDTSQDPVANLRVSAWSRIPPEFTQEGAFSDGESKPATRFRYTLPRACYVTYTLFNAVGDTTRTLVDQLQPAGVHELIWNGMAQGPPEPAAALGGAYRAVFEARDQDTDTLLHTDEIIAVMFLLDPEQTILGYADDAGEFTTTEQLFFPHLYDWEPFVGVDEMGNPLGTFSYLDTVRVALADTAAHRTQYFDVVVEDGNNSFQLVWDPTKATSWQPGAICPRPLDPLEGAWQEVAFGQVGHPEGACRQRTLQPPVEFRVYQNYPNPFN